MTAKPDTYEDFAAWMKGPHERMGPVTVTDVCRRFTGIPLSTATEWLKRYQSWAQPETSTREPGSIIHLEGTELRTACGHSYRTCHTNHCFRPGQIRAQRDAAALDEIAAALKSPANAIDLLIKISVILNGTGRA